MVQSLERSLTLTRNSYCKRLRGILKYTGSRHRTQKQLDMKKKRKNCDSDLSLCLLITQTERLITCHILFHKLVMMVLGLNLVMGSLSLEVVEVWV